MATKWSGLNLTASELTQNGLCTDWITIAWKELAIQNITAASYENLAY